MDSAVAQVYQQDIGSRGKLGRMSFYKKGGKGTSPLGKKYMTNAEINARHGECKEYKLNRFMPFSEFRTMPPDIQALWINAIQDKYDVGLYPISRIIFNFPNDDSLKDHLKRNGIFKEVHPERKRGKTGLQQLRDDVENFRKGIGDEPQLVEVISEPIEPDIPKFMSYEDFKDLPANSQVIFVNRLLDEYGVGMSALDNILFKFRTNGALHHHLNKLAVIGQIHAPGRGGSISKFKEGRTKLKADVKAWEIENIRSYHFPSLKPTEEPACASNEIDFAVVGVPKEEVVEERPTLWYEPLTGRFFYNKAEAEEHMKWTGNELLCIDDLPPVIEMPEELNEHCEKAQPGTKFEFSREYFGREIDIDQLKLLNSMLESLEEGKQLRIRIEVEAVDNAG